MTELLTSKRLKLNQEKWYCVRGSKESKEPAWPYCTMDHEKTSNELVYNNHFKSRQDCDNLCGRFEERLQNQVGQYLDRTDIETLVKAAPSKNAGFLEIKSQYRDYALLDQLLNDQRSHEKLLDSNYVNQLLQLITKPNTANWRFATNMMRELATMLYERLYDETSAMYNIETAMKALLPILKDKSTQNFHDSKEYSRYLFEAVLADLKNCKFATHLVDQGLLDIVNMSEYDDKILVIFLTELYNEMSEITPRWTCWDKLFHTFVSKTDFSGSISDYGSPGSQDVAQFFAVAANLENKFKDFQIKSATRFLTTPQAYDLGGVQVFLTSMFDYEILPLEIQLRFNDILEYLVNLDHDDETIQEVRNFSTVYDLATTFKPYLTSDEPIKKRFAKLLALLAQELETTTPSS